MVPPPMRSHHPKSRVCSLQLTQVGSLTESDRRSHTCQSRDGIRGPVKSPPLSPSPLRKTCADQLRSHLNVLSNALGCHRLGDHDHIPLDGEPDQNL